MTISAGLRLLRDRYMLIEQRVSEDEGSESWVGVDDEDKKLLVRLWPYAGDNPPELLRALWDAELRMLYRVASAPGADETMVVIRDAGLDREARCFVMISEAEHSGGYEPLSSALRNRQNYPWLKDASFTARRELWQGLARLADGISLLHEQNILHRNVEAENVYFHPDGGVSSFRLGGFEWSVRLGVPDTRSPPGLWSSPPEFFTDSTYGYRPETDWYAFGMLAVRCLRSIENFSNNAVEERHGRVMQSITRAPATQLSELEKTWLKSLVARDPTERLTNNIEIRAQLRDIINALETVSLKSDSDLPLVLCVDHKGNAKLLERMLSLGFVPNPDQPNESFNPLDPFHAARYVQFIELDLQAADPCLRISISGNRRTYVLQGNQLVVSIGEYEFTNITTRRRERTWDIAYCISAAELRNADASLDLYGQAVVVRSLVDVRRGNVRPSQNWRRYLPVVDKATQLRSDLSKFHKFIRCTNQLELLFRDAEIFAYRMIGQPNTTEAKSEIVIQEMERERPPLDIFEIRGGLVEHLQREIASGKQHARRVLLTTEDSLIFKDREFVRQNNAWTVEQINTDDRTILLSQPKNPTSNVAPSPEGFIRAWGMFGQIPLIRRRKRATDRLEKHSFLLRSLLAPGQVYMDTGSISLPVQVSHDKVDAAKRAALEDILRVRPIYALQGPPGTGKTTLVAHLLRQIFEEDPVAQVLITAQAHGAVDVLRTKVRDEAFFGISGDKLPLAVRIGSERDEEETNIEGSVGQVALSILEQARTALSGRTERSELQETWCRELDSMIAARKAGVRRTGNEDFDQVVKRGASITYCTTSAGDLEALADSIQSFDWTIVEEAGKAYAFDLALPLQTGHRWLLIGDHKQLPPYKYEDHEKGISRLEHVISALMDLPGLNSSLLDFEWLRTWSDMDAGERDSFKSFAHDWLNSFRQIFVCASRATGTELLTKGSSIGAAAGKLTEQHRMHPTIGRLISAAFYGDELINRTQGSDGQPLANVIHPFAQPKGISGRAVVWIDTDWIQKNPQSTYGEQGRRQGQTPFTNPGEARAISTFIRELRIESQVGEGLELAVLAPYTQQVSLLNNEFDQKTLPVGVRLRQGRKRRRSPISHGLELPLAHTVDSFQGDQADIVCVSLVRNNTFPPGEGLGFLEESSRLNVLLSRAKQLLVLVGSWDFFEYQLSTVSLSTPQHELWHWKKTMSLLAEWFAAGEAVRLYAGR